MAGPVGESWEIVDRVEAQSVVGNGPWAGRSIRELIEADPIAVMGPGWVGDHRFPILVKWLDCRERLSLQVHPPADIASSLNGEPKTENWYFARCDEGAAVFAGLKDGVTVDEFERALIAGTAEQCMRRQAVRAGDSLLIRSGVMHAIDAGNVILEIQENSDTTFRVYDWGRTGLDGNPRALHVRESMASLRAAAEVPPATLVTATDRDGTLADCAEFRIRKAGLGAGERSGFAAAEQPRIVSVISGKLTTSDPTVETLKAGDNVLVPYAAALDLQAVDNSVILVTEDFARPGTH